VHVPAWGALTPSPINYAHYFSALRGAPPGYAYMVCYLHSTTLLSERVLSFRTLDKRPAGFRVARGSGGLYLLIDVARILSGVHFFPKKLTTFLVIALKDRVNIPPNLSHQAKTVLKFTLALAGVHFVSWGCTFTFFPVNYSLKNFFTTLGMQVHPLHLLATPMYLLMSIIRLRTVYKIIYYTDKKDQTQVPVWHSNNKNKRGREP